MDERPWVDGLTIGDALRRRASEHPDGEALVFSRHGWRATYGEYDARVDTVAKALLGIGVGAGDHVAIWATNWPQWTILNLATARIGAVLVTINPAYRPEELEYALRQSDTTALFLIDRFKSSDYFGMLDEVCPELRSGLPGALRCERLPKLRSVVSIADPPGPGMLAWARFLGAGLGVTDRELRNRERAVDPDSPVNIQYTSGTTGRPKGVQLTHRNLLLNAYYVGMAEHLTRTDRVCVPVPFYHCFGTVIGTLCSMVHGATMLVPDEYFEAGSVLRCIREEGATAVYGVPTMFIAMLEHESFVAGTYPSLRTGIMAGSPCPVEVMHKVIDELGAREMTIAYGLTEASPAITQTRVDDPVELRVGTVGRRIPGIEVRIADPETGEALADGEQGELCCRGHNVMLGYYHMPEATADAIDPEGWLHSGDLAVRDPNGYIRITGRIKDMIIRGGENIYPREIEELLYTHPAVEEAQVVGVPDPRFGEEVCAWIRLARGAVATEDEIREFCKRGLSYFKVPRYVKFVSEFPLTVTGKVQKFKIREMAAGELEALA
jgi:fatty-acyl-CoA synthase